MEPGAHLQPYFGQPSAKFRPYLGAGVTYTWFGNINSAAPPPPVKSTLLRRLAPHSGADNRVAQ
ncbi:OmpW family outer membrane protein [Burkholderia sp. Nafp2/4-1b]|uniref:OmpW family outer membrane protein n=1 Tax=Burkholderia sp. Nafp2/4-1b TaxID=2116686 RepID=UPI0023E3609D|nr:OmpW family outer membrane protein [Burkholderia sp. Nafp2/4-1b]